MCVNIKPFTVPLHIATWCIFNYFHIYFMLLLEKKKSSICFLRPFLKLFQAFFLNSIHLNLSFIYSFMGHAH